MKEANKVLKKEGKYKNLKEEDVERIMDDTNDFIFGRDIPEDPEGFAKGGRVRMAGGGILKFLSKFIKNKDVNKTSIDLTEKELKYLNELITDTGGGKFKAEILEEVPSLTIKNNKLIVDQGDLDSFSNYLDDLYLSELKPSGRGANLMPPRLRGSALFDDSVVGKLFRQSKATGGRIEKAGGGVSQGLDYLMGIERRGYAYGSGLKLLNLFKKSKTNLQKEIEKAIDNISLTGDMKLDADRVVDDMLESMNIDRDAVDGYDILDAYDKAYKRIAKLKGFNNLDNKLMDLEKKSKYKQGDPITEENFGDTPFATSQKTLDNLKKARKMTKGMSLEDEMNMVLNQYDKSMFVRNEQGMVDVANPENIQKMALLLQKDHPNLYKKLQEQASQVDTIENFDITGRKPNAKGGPQGLDYLLGM
jgi:hypothetical protein